MQNLLEALKLFSDPDQILLGEPMAAHTTFRIGGPADVMYLPHSDRQLMQALAEARRCAVPALVIGNGSNLLVRDGGVRGLVIMLGDGFAGIELDGCIMRAQAGVRLSKVAQVAQAAGLAGLEFASGIPGTLGGGVVMNAGAYGGQLSDVLVSADVVLDGEVRTYSLEELEMGYRTTMPLKRGGIVTGAVFELHPDDPEAIEARMRDLNGRRRDKQPLNFPSAGSTFKRPEGYFAGALIEGAGLKGFSVGGAQVSPKHAGFVVNTGGATAADVLNLIKHVQDTVFAKDGVRLELEVRIVGED